MGQKKILSENAVDFIDEKNINLLISSNIPDKIILQNILNKSLDKISLSLEETAYLLNVESEEMQEEIFATARKLKERVYGNRIVIFAPLYAGNKCINDCSYCSFKKSNKEASRMTLTQQQLIEQTVALEKAGHKRVILVFGEHPSYDAKFISECVKTIYSVKEGKGDIRRININAAPLNVEGFKEVGASGIGTFQIFQETYHKESYLKHHGTTHSKSDYLYRLDGLSRAMEAGVDDVGIGALFGLYDWKFEVMGLVSHAIYLKDRYGVGPHTISFPRLKSANGVDMDGKYDVSDDDFKKIIAILRLSVPYTGLILTARESAELRREVMSFGVSQIDAGSCIDLGGYGKKKSDSLSSQFSLGDERSLDEVIGELLKDDYIPSFCTSCYRSGRTGEHFMEFAVPGFIKRFCRPNAILTLMEYLIDYSSPETRAAGLKMIDQEKDQITDEKVRRQVEDRLDELNSSDKRDFYF